MHFNNFSNSKVNHGSDLKNIDRCPHCKKATPLLNNVWLSQLYIKEGSGYGKKWGVYQCSSCKDCILAEGIPGNEETKGIERIYPETEQLSEILPPNVRRFLKQAIESLDNPDCAVMAACSAVDSILKEKGLCGDYSLHRRIDEAVSKQILSIEIGSWAHEIRSLSNYPRHADEDCIPTENDAKQIVEFTKMIADILFVLPAKIKLLRNKDN
jgi:uncharacterized protein (UPF0147 family)